MRERERKEEEGEGERERESCVLWILSSSLISHTHSGQRQQSRAPRTHTHSHAQSGRVRSGSAERTPSVAPGNYHRSFFCSVAGVFGHTWKDFLKTLTRVSSNFPHCFPPFSTPLTADTSTTSNASILHYLPERAGGCCFPRRCFTLPPVCGNSAAESG